MSQVQRSKTACRVGGGVRGDGGGGREGREGCEEAGGKSSQMGS